MERALLSSLFAELGMEDFPPKNLWPEATRQHSLVRLEEESYRVEALALASSCVVLFDLTLLGAFLRAAVR